MTKEFDAKNAAKSRRVCAEMAEAASTGKRVLTGREYQILDMWPKFDDGEYVWFGDGVRAHGGAIIVKAIEFTRGAVCVKDAANGDWNASTYAMHPLKRPVQSVLDSWERLEEDAAKGVCEYFSAEERGCYTCIASGLTTSCALSKNLDIIRRAKALAGIEVD